MEVKKFMSLDEYSNEYIKSGENDFYEFLRRKKQDALELEDQELVNYIEMIYNQACEDEDRYNEYLQEEYEREEREKERKRKEELEEYELYDNYEDAEEQISQEEKYKEYLLKIELCKKKIEEYQEILADETLDEYERIRYESLISAEEDDIEFYTKEAKELQNTIEVTNLENSLTNMTSVELESMSEEELQQIVANNENIIEENNNVIKNALVEKILSQQRIISEQQLEISRLNSHKKEL